MAATIGELNVEIGARFDKLDKAFDQMGKRINKQESSLGGLGQAFKKVGALAAGAFSVQQIVQFTAESIKLAAEMEGVGAAFDRLNNKSLLDNLRKATAGTVSDLELMKQAVRANNFKIPLEQLGSLFEFARRRAKDTGESVDYLVNSIVMGIGRKSPLILDNLGISAVELRKRLNGVGTEAATIGDIAKIVGNIATEELGKMGEESITTSDRIAQITAETENLKVSIGQKLTPAISNLGTVWLKTLEDVNDTLDDNIGLVDKLLMAFGGPAQKARVKAELEAKRALDDHNKSQEKAIELGRKAAAGGYKASLEAEKIKKQQELNAAVAEYAKKLEETKVEIDALQSSVDNLIKGNDKDLLSYFDTEKKDLSVNTAFDTSVFEEEDAIEDFNKEMQEADEKTKNLQGSVMALAGDITNSLGDAFAGAILHGQNFGDVMLKVLQQLVAKLLSAVATAAALALIFSAFGGGAGLSFGSILGKTLAIPGFAEGGIVSSPTLAMIGEGGSSEVVLPTAKLETLLNQGGNMTNANLTTTIRGEDLVLAMERTNKRINRAL